MKASSVAALALLAVVALMPCSTDAKVFTKCELFKTLTTNMTTAMPKCNMTTKEMIAKVVCKAEKTTNFDTTTVKASKSFNVPVKILQLAGIDAGETDRNGKSDRPGPPQNGPHGKHGPGGRRSRSPDNTSPGEMKSVDLGNLYGLFQLSNRFVCSDGHTGSRNICQLQCSALLDDDISDDIACLKTITKTMKDNIPANTEATKNVKMMMESVFSSDCLSVNADTYFSECV